MDRKQRYLLICILALGLFLRAGLMPVTFHHDMVFLGYVPGHLARGETDVFSSYWQKYNPFPGSTATYPPLFFISTAAFRVLENRFSPELDNWLEKCWIKYRADNSGQAGTVVAHSYFDLPGENLLFRNLFLLKSHFLLFDALIAALLFLLVSDPKKRLAALGLWAFNPFAIITAYAHGQHDMIITSLLTAALFLAWRGRPGPAVSVLCLGFMIKLLPLLFIPPLALYFCRGNLKQLLRLSLWAAVPLLIVIGPLLAVAGPEIFKFFLHPEATGRVTDTGMLHILQKTILLAGYLALLYWSLRKGQGVEGKPSYRDMLALFSSVLLLLCLGMGLEIRYFVWVTPFLILLSLEDRTTAWLIGLLALTFFLLRYPPYAPLQGRLFAPLYPEYFSSMPSWDSVLRQVITPNDLYRLCYRVFLVSAAGALFLVWRPESTLPARAVSWLRRLSAGAFLLLSGSVAILTVIGVSRHPGHQWAGNQVMETIRIRLATDPHFLWFILAVLGLLLTTALISAVLVLAPSRR